MHLRLYCRREKTAVVVYCEGRICFGDKASFLFDEVAALLAKRRHVLLHFGSVKAVDAAGLGTLAGLMTRARAFGGEISICNLSGQLANLLDLTRLSQTLKVYETEEEALSLPGKLLHEAYLRSADQTNVEWQNRNLVETALRGGRQ